MSYAQPADCLKRYDQRVIGNLASDTGVAVTPTNLLTDPNLQAALDDAAGEIDMAILVAERYQPSDLAALTGTAQAILFRLNCDLAYIFLVRRRGTDVSTLPQYNETQKTLQLLRDGERVFNIQSAQDAGLPTSEFPSAQQYTDLNLERDYCGTFYPQRVEQQYP